MFFLLRIGFWLGVVCVLLSSGSTQPSAPEAQINATEAVTLATAAVVDARGFCDRQPDACAAGGKVATAIGYKAEAGARTLYEFITNKLASPVKTDAKSDTRAAVHNDGTLMPSDVAPAWRAPVPLPPRRPDRAPRQPA